MAQKRMFSKDITESDAFREMPSSSQNLYFHLGMSADDDGFLGGYKGVARSVGSSEDDFKILVAKKFVLPFKSGVIVIKHWNINNNKIDADRYKKTKYDDEAKELNIKQNKAYTLDKEQGEPFVHSLGTDCAPRVDQSRVDQNRLITRTVPVVRADVEKESKKTKKERLNSGYSEKFESFWSAYPNKIAKGKAFEVFSLLSNELQNDCLNSINRQVENNHFWQEFINNGDGGDSAPHPTTWLNQKRWEDVVVKKERKGRNGAGAKVMHIKYE